MSASTPPGTATAPVAPDTGTAPGDGSSATATGTITLPAAAEPAADGGAAPEVAGAPTKPRPEAFLPVTPTATPAESPTAPPASSSGEASASSSDGRGAGTDTPDTPPDPATRTATDGATPRAGVPAAPVTTPAVAAAPASPSAAANVAFSSPLPAAPSPATALEATIRMAGENGFTRARLTLRPAELGGVEVFLREGSAGLTATVVAETSHAAHLLESSALELQRRLSAQGLELTSLQISVGGDSAGAAHGGREREAAAPTGTRHDEAAPEPVAAQKTRAIDLGGGVLVDVLA